MNPTLTKAAKVLAEYEYGDGHDEPWEPWIGHATAVLQAIREPSEEMLDAGDSSTGLLEGREGPGFVWQAMINCILKPRERGMRRAELIFVRRRWIWHFWAFGVSRSVSLPSRRWEIVTIGLGPLRLQFLNWGKRWRFLEETRRGGGV